MAHLKIISDLDESELEFESDYVYNRGTAIPSR